MNTAQKFAAAATFLAGMTALPALGFCNVNFEESGTHVNQTGAIEQGRLREGFSGSFKDTLESCARWIGNIEARAGTLSDGDTLFTNVLNGTFAYSSRARGEGNAVFFAGEEGSDLTNVTRNDEVVVAIVKSATSQADVHTGDVYVLDGKKFTGPYDSVADANSAHPRMSGIDEPVPGLR